MQPIEIIVLIIALGIVILPIVLKFLGKKEKKGTCGSSCDLCNKDCAKRILEQFKIDED